MGGLTWFLARAEARRRFWSGVGLVVLIGLTGAVVLASWAGARRTATSYERLNASVNHADFTVATEGDPAAFDPTIASDGPGVAQASIVNGYAMALLTDDGLVDLESENALIVPTDTIGFQQIDRPIMVEGRPPDPDAADEIVVPEGMRDQGYTVGRAMDTCVVDFSAAVAFGQGVLEGTASAEVQREFADAVCLRMTLRVVGITGPGPAEVVTREDTETENYPVGSPAFTQLPGVVSGFSFVLVDMEDGADRGAYVDHVLDGTPPDAGVSVSASAVRTTTVERALEPYVRALTLFALAVALAGLGVAGPALARWAGTPGGDRATLRAMGVRPHQLRVASAVRGAGLAVAAGLVAVGGAAAMSNQFPRGIGARIEPDPGYRIDGYVLGLGLLAVVATGAVLGAAAPTRDRVRVRRPSRVAEAMQSIGLAPGPVAGIRSALAGDGRGAGILPTIAGVALALVAVISSLTYEAGLARLLDEPARYGWTWDWVLDAPDSTIDPEVLAALDAAPEVAGVSVGYRSQLTRDGGAVQLFAIDPVEGDVYPTILEGRRPAGKDEIALGGQTLDRLDASIGDEVDFRGPQGEAVTLTIVGRTLLPISSLSDDLSVGEGGLVDVSLVQQLAVKDASIALVDLHDRASDDVIQGVLAAADDPRFGGVQVVGPVLAADLRSYDAVRRTPLALASALSLLGLGVLAHTVATSVRRRRLELAVLRALGFARRDLRASVRWSVLTVVGTCLLIAVPLGIAAGRTLWDAFAAGLGVDSGSVTPVGPIVAVVLLTIAAGILFSIIPARQAARLRTAEVLRTE